MILEALDAETLDGDEEWWRIYDESFPLDEREPRRVIVDSVRDGVGLAARAREGERTIGLSTVHLLNDPPAIFLVYLGVEKKRRGGGVGAALLERTWQLAVPRMPHALGMVWEVDMPARADSPAELAKRERRIRFFEHWGGRLLARDYTQPPVSAAPVPMHLMAKSEAPLDEALIERLVRAIYFEKYGAANGIDRALLAALLAG